MKPVLKHILWKAESLEQSVRKSMDGKPSKELLEIWTKNDREEWSDEAFEVIRRILLERGEEPPPQKPWPGDKVQAVEDVQIHEDTSVIFDTRFFLLGGLMSSIAVGLLLPFIWIMARLLIFDVAVKDSVKYGLRLSAFAVGFGAPYGFFAYTYKFIKKRYSVSGFPSLGQRKSYQIYRHLLPPLTTSVIWATVWCIASNAWIGFTVILVALGWSLASFVSKDPFSRS